MGKKKEKNRRVNITGTIIPSEYGSKGNILGISICTDDEEEFIIEQSDVCDELMDCINDNVRLTGSIFIDEDSEYYISVKKYEIIQPMGLDFEDLEEENDE